MVGRPWEYTDSMKMNIFKATRLHATLLGLCALVIVAVTISAPQKVYTREDLVVRCGEPLSFLSVDFDYRQPALPVAINCGSWNPMDAEVHVNPFFYGLDVLFVFALLFGLVIVLPRLVGLYYIPFRMVDDGQKMHSVVVPVLTTAILISSLYTVHINSIMIAADNDEFTWQEAAQLVKTENPTLSKYGRNDNTRRIEIYRIGGGWNLQFLYKKSDVISWGKCFKVLYYGDMKQVRLTGVFADEKSPVYKLDETCHPLL